MTPPFKRRKKLIRPALQLRMTGVFIGLVSLMLLLQFVLLTAEIHHAANALPADGPRLLAEANTIVGRVVLISATVFLPLTLIVGILSTFRIAGPLYRFERFLEALRNGERPEDFRLRDGDELHDLAALLNDATRPMRADGTSSDDIDERAEERNAA
ncbi:MAG: hypothetical protein AAFP86_18355 [Planctomycetota bacterium]